MVKVSPMQMSPKELGTEFPPVNSSHSCPFNGESTIKTNKICSVRILLIVIINSQVERLAAINFSANHLLTKISFTGATTYYFINVTLPFTIRLSASEKISSAKYVYTPGSSFFVLNFPSHPASSLFVSMLFDINTLLPHLSYT